MKNTVYRYLLKIKGIGPFYATQICDSLGISTNTDYSKLHSQKLDSLNRLLALIRKNASTQFPNLFIEHALLRNKENAIQRLIKINTHRGRRIKLGYPARGQRTRSNAITAASSRVQVANTSR